ncbi:MAG: hypothetical protein ACC642_07300, partial [Pseudomonadales bacterium]
AEEIVETYRIDQHSNAHGELALHRKTGGTNKYNRGNEKKKYRGPGYLRWIFEVPKQRFIIDSFILPMAYPIRLVHLWSPTKTDVRQSSFSLCGQTGHFSPQIQHWGVLLTV